MKQTGTTEFILLAAMLISMVALSIDSMLPALPAIAEGFALSDRNDQQYVISSLFLGLGVGQLIYGPLSDAIGRKKPIYIGILVYLASTVLCLYAPTFEVFLAGRFLQGLGASSARIVTLAVVRDRFEGTTMAQVMSFVTAIFILVPAIAPLLGQSILLLGDWHLIFIMLLVFAGAALLWFGLRQPESLPAERRVPLHLPQLIKSIGFILRHPVTLGATLVQSLMFAGFMVYLSSTQQIFVDLYGTGALFPLYFATLALAIGAASVVNARIVHQLGIVRVCYLALIGQCSLSIIMLLVSTLLFQHQPPLWLFMLYCLPLFFVIGLQFGNLNALAMHPLGHIAGLGASVIGALSTSLAVPIGMLVGQYYNGTPVPLIAGFVGFGCCGLALFHWLCRHENI